MRKEWKLNPDTTVVVTLDDAYVEGYGETASRRLVKESDTGDCLLATDTVFMLRPDRLAELEAKVAKLRKRAMKLGVEGAADVAVKVVGERVMVRRLRGETVVLAEERHLLVTATGPKVRVNGWAFLAKVTPVAEGMNTVKCGPRAEVTDDELVAYRTMGMRCDHCRKLRRRADMFVVRDEAGTTMVVGRTCLKDFVGDATAMRALMVASWELDELARDLAESSYGGGGGEWTFGTEAYCAVVAARIRTKGWLSRKAVAETGLAATCDVAWTALGYLVKGIPPGLEAAARRDAMELVAELTPTEADVAEAKAAVAWARTLKDKPKATTFEWNLAALAEADTVRWKNMGFVAAMVMAYAKERETLKRFARKAETSRWLATAVGEKVDVVATVTGLRELDGMYPCTLATFSTDDGCELKWFASNWPGLPVGARVRVRGKVKKLDEYKGVKNTVLTRATLDEMKETA